MAPMTITLPSGNLHVFESDSAQCGIEMSGDCCHCSMEAVQIKIVDLKREHHIAMHQLQMDASSLNVTLAQHMDEARAEIQEQNQQFRCARCACNTA